MKRLISLLILFALLLGTGFWFFYQEQKPKSCAIKRLPCQQQVVCFERTYHMENLQKAIDLLKARRYTLVSHIQKAEYMESALFGHVDKAAVDAMVTAAIDAQVPHGDTPSGETLLIDYLIYENDKLHPGKKTDKSKLYEGYLAFSFKLDGKTVYKFQIDFMDEKGADIPDRVACAVRSLLSLDAGKKE
jgi:hypothetical protein